jgi:hypothetical protein
MDGKGRQMKDSHIERIIGIANNGKKIQRHDQSITFNDLSRPKIEQASMGRVRKKDNIFNRRRQRQTAKKKNRAEKANIAIQYI